VTNNNDTSVELFDGFSHTVDHLNEKREQRGRERVGWEEQGAGVRGVGTHIEKPRSMWEIISKCTERGGGCMYTQKLILFRIH
jgi:hypothetical protein